MKILGIRTDSLVCEIYLLDDKEIVQSKVIETGRSLALLLPGLVRDLISATGAAMSDLGGVVCFAGPGSFTGLRIGHTFANALVYSLEIPIVQEQGDEWLSMGCNKLLRGDNEKILIPHYGAEANITKSK